MARDTGSFSTSVTPVQLPNAPCVQVTIRNTDASIGMLIGWTAAKQLFTIPAGVAHTVRCGNANQIWIKSASGTPAGVYFTS